MEARIVLLPGDGIGPEVTKAARSALERSATLGGHTFTFDEALIGGCAIDATGSALPEETVRRCEGADALLLGAVGGPQWSDPTAPVRPEQGILALRSHFGLFANLRPVPVFPALRDLAPLRSELLEGVDLLVVRELTGGIYFGERHEQGNGDRAWDTMIYTVPEVQRIAHVAFRAARGRRSRVTSVDKANVLASMRLWRRTVDTVASQYPDVELRHHLVDSCAMQIMRTPAEFDVLLAGNMFGDILSDEASILAGSLGLLPSASLGDGSFGLYEPIHGSAPDIAGRGIANPLGAMLSAAMLLRHSLGLEEEAANLEKAVSSALAAGLRTADLCRPGETGVTTGEMAEAVISKLSSS